MKLGILTIGDELLMGQITDTNSAYIASSLTAAGFEVSHIDTIGDRAEEVVSALDKMKNSVQLLIITGGLGPTKDDLTKYTLCEYFNDTLALNDEIYTHLSTMLSGMGNLMMNELNKGQAYLPQSATILKNMKGTASGMWFEQNGFIVIALPGVPFEMQHLMDCEVMPRLTALFPQEISYKAVITYDIPESTLAETLSDWEDALPDFIKLAYLPNLGSVKLRLTCYSKADISKQKQLHLFYLSLQDFLSKHKISYFSLSSNNSPIEKLIGEELLKINCTLSIAESCTGGYISHLITSIAGSSAYFKGGVVAYSNKIKEDILGVSNIILSEKGAVSKEVVEAMALGVKDKFNTDYAIASSGIAGPDGGTKDKPVGLVWIAIATPTSCVSKCFNFTFTRERNIEKAGLKALLFLYQRFD